jgi:hypothetical protein
MLWAGQVRNLGSISERNKSFLFSTVVKMALGPTQPAIQLGTGGSFLEGRVKWQRCEADSSISSSAEVKDESSYSSASPHSFI